MIEHPGQYTFYLLRLLDHCSSYTDCNGLNGGSKTTQCQPRFPCKSSRHPVVTTVLMYGNIDLHKYPH